MTSRELQLVRNLSTLCSTYSSLIQLHSLTIKTGFFHDRFIAAKLINCYSNYASLEATRKLFDETRQPTVYIWNSLLKSYCKNNSYVETLHLFRRMMSDQKPDSATISIALKASSGLCDLTYGTILHGFIKRNYEMDSNLFLGSALIDTYTKCGLMDEAFRVFEEYPDPDNVMWTRIITGYQQNGDPYSALNLFSQMLMEGHISPDLVTLVSVLSSYAQLQDPIASSCVHGFLIKNGVENSLSVCNALLNCYSKSGSINAAVTLFRKMEEKDAISWATMVSCYAHNNVPEYAINLFSEMIYKRVEINSVSVISVLQACEATCNLEEGKKVHEFATSKGYDSQVFVSTSLIDMYMACSSPKEAMEVFEKIPNKDSVSWMAFLIGCIQNGMAYKSMEIFVNMMLIGIKPDVFLMVKILTACSNLGVLQQAMCLHNYIIKCGFEDNRFIGASLIESYSKCGTLHNAVKLFNSIDDKDVVIFSTMINGYGIHGKGKEALDLFNHMVVISRINPNNVTLLSILSACSHAGLINEGVELFNSMLSEYQLTPELNHYAIMVDLFGRMGELDKAIGVINDMHVPGGPQIWGALMGACRIHHDIKVGEIAARKLIECDSSDVGYLILLSNMHAVDENWDDVVKVRSRIEGKVNGESAIEVMNEVHSFSVNDRVHPCGESIRGLLRSLVVIMREEGCVHDLDLTAHDENF